MDAPTSDHEGGEQLSRVRTCIGCRTRRPAAEMRRVRRDAEGDLVLGAGTGRGAWLCEDIACLDSAERRRAFGRALRADVKPGEIARLREAWSSRRGGPSRRSDRAVQS